MKKINFLIILVFCVNGLIFSQGKNYKQLKVVNISEYKGVYIIKGIDFKADTLTILSPMEKIKKKCKYDKIKIGATYNFNLKENSTYISNLIIRCNGTIFWKTGDDPKKMPFFASNTKDAFIIDE